MSPGVEHFVLNDCARTGRLRRNAQGFSSNLWARDAPIDASMRDQNCNSVRTKFAPIMKTRTDSHSNSHAMSAFTKEFLNVDIRS